MKEMTVRRSKETIEKDTVTITLERSDAEVLRCVLGRVCAAYDIETYKKIADLRVALENVGVSSADVFLRGEIVFIDDVPF
jgi:hypothetical protein